MKWLSGVKQRGAGDMNGAIGKLSREGLRGEMFAAPNATMGSSDPESVSREKGRTAIGDSVDHPTSILAGSSDPDCERGERPKIRHFQIGCAFGWAGGAKAPAIHQHSRNSQ